MVYIREAHPQDSRRPDREIFVDDPKTMLERAKIAGTCQVGLKLKLPMLIDDEENSTDGKYSGWPDRLFLIGKDGKIAFAGGRGPFGFKPADLEDAIEQLD